MKVLVILSVIVAIATANPARQYFPEENDPHRVTYFAGEGENGEIIYDDLSLPRPISRASANDITIYLHTRLSNEPEVIIPADFNTMRASKNFNTKKINVFIIHGWKNSQTSPVNKLLTEAILSRHDHNVFVVDWSPISKRDYITASFAVKPIGEALAEFINEMIHYYHLSPKQFNLLGHSLGAHVAGGTGAKVQGKVNYIVGMDPAGPFFSLKDIDNRVDDTDADFVQIIHTTGNKLSFASSLGHADYFPNGGSKQPGCGWDILGTCAHSRSYEYVAESIKTSNFTAHSCNSYEEFTIGVCQDEDRSYLGGFRIDKGANGDYYLKTNSEPPYALT